MNLSYLKGLSPVYEIPGITLSLSNNMQHSTFPEKIVASFYNRFTILRIIAKFSSFLNPLTPRNGE